MPKGLLIIISAPSGVGKTTILKRIISEVPGCAFSVSHTTRPRREQEVHGRDYYFVSDDEFDELVLKDSFIEWAFVHNYKYGTSKSEVERLLDSGANILFEVDYQGGISLMRHFPDSVSIFLLPPSYEEIEKRLLRRGTDSHESIRLRVENAQKELTYAREYSYLILNDEVDRAVADVKSVIRAHQLKRERQMQLLCELLEGIRS